MDTGETFDRSPEGAAQRGLWRLMLKLPALRGALQLMAARRTAFAGLFEAYEDACVTLQRLRGNDRETHGSMVREYEAVCSEIESEIIQFCLDDHPDVPK